MKISPELAKGGAAAALTGVLTLVGPAASADTLQSNPEVATISQEQIQDLGGSAISSATEGLVTNQKFKMAPEDYTTTVVYKDKKGRRATVTITLNKTSNLQNTLALTDAELGIVSFDSLGRNSVVSQRDTHRNLYTGLRDDRTIVMDVYGIRKKHPNANASVVVDAGNALLNNWTNEKINLPKPN